MSHGQTVLISLWTCSLFWICVTDLEGFVRFLQVVGLAVAALTGVEWEQAPWRKRQHHVSMKKHGRVGEQGNLSRVFCIMSSSGKWWHRHSLCTGVEVTLICVLWSSWSFGLFSSRVCRGINCGVESCTFWIFDPFWKSCLFLCMYSHKSLWILSSFLN